jgi:hypothetical protein
VSDNKSQIRTLLNTVEDITIELDTQKSDYLVLRTTSLKKEEELEDKILVQRAKIDELQKHVRTLWDEKEEQERQLNGQIEKLQKDIARIERERESEMRAQKLMTANLQFSAQTLLRLSHALEDSERDIRQRVSGAEVKMHSLSNELHRVGDNVRETIAECQRAVAEQERLLQEQLEKEKERERHIKILEECLEALQKERDSLKSERAQLQSDLEVANETIRTIEQKHEQERLKWQERDAERLEEIRYIGAEKERLQGELSGLQVLFEQQQREWKQDREDAKQREDQLQCHVQEANERAMFAEAEREQERLLQQERVANREVEFAEELSRVSVRSQELERERELLQSRLLETQLQHQREREIAEELEKEREIEREREREQERKREIEREKDWEREREQVMEKEQQLLELIKQKTVEMNSTNSKRSSRRNSSAHSKSHGSRSRTHSDLISSEKSDVDSNVIVGPDKLRSASQTSDRSLDTLLSVDCDSDGDLSRDRDCVDAAVQTEASNETDHSLHSQKVQNPKSDNAISPDFRTTSKLDNGSLPQVTDSIPVKEEESFLLLPKKTHRQPREVSEAVKMKRERKALLKSTRIASVDDDDDDNNDDDDVEDNEDWLDEESVGPVETNTQPCSISVQTMDENREPFQRLSAENIEQIVRDSLQTNNYYFSQDKGEFTTELPVDEAFLQQLIGGFSTLSEDALQLVELAERDRDSVDRAVRDLILKTARDLVVKIETSREVSLSRARTEHSEQLSEQLTHTTNQLREEQRIALIEQNEKFRLESEARSRDMELQLQKAAIKLKKLREKFDQDLIKEREKWEQELEGVEDDPIINESAAIESTPKPIVFSDSLPVDPIIELERPSTTETDGAMRRRRAAVILSRSKPISSVDREKERHEMRLELEKEIRAQLQSENEARRGEREFYLHSNTKTDEEERVGEVVKMMEQLPEKFQGRDIHVMRQELLSGELGSIGDVRRENFDRLRGKSLGSDELVNLTAIEHTLRYDTDTIDESESTQQKDARERQQRMQHKTLEIQKHMLKQRALEKIEILDLFSFLHGTEKQLRLLSSLSAWQSLVYYQSGGLFLDVLSVHRDVLVDCVREKGGVSAALKALSEKSSDTKTERWPESLRVRALELFRQDLIKDRNALRSELLIANDRIEVLEQQLRIQPLPLPTLIHGSSLATTTMTALVPSVSSNKRKNSRHNIPTILPAQIEDDREAQEHSLSIERDNDVHSESSSSTHNSFTSVRQHFSHLQAMLDKENRQKPDSNEEKVKNKREIQPLSKDVLQSIANDIDFSETKRNSRPSHLADREHAWNARSASKAHTSGGMHYKLDNIGFLALRGDVDMYDLLSTLHQV